MGRPSENDCKNVTAEGVKKKKGHDKKIKAYKKAAVPPLKEDKASPRAR